jgi:AraC-like DNA-binding protein
MLTYNTYDTKFNEEINDFPGFRMREVVDIMTEEDFLRSSSKPYYQIFIQIDGKTNCIADAASLTLKKNDVLFLPPNVLFQVTCCSVSKVIWIIFSKEFFCASKKDTVLFENSMLFNSVEGKFSVVSKIMEAIDFIRELRFINKLIRENKRYALDLARVFLQGIVLHAQIKRDLDGNDRDLERHLTVGCDLVVKFENLVSKKYKETRNVNDYADELNVTSRNLTNSVMKLRGITAKTLICDRVMLTAKRLLTYSEQSIKEISELLGFEDENAFVKFFKYHSDPPSAPGEFRLKNREIFLG